jgi:hypothetical protein
MSLIPILAHGSLGVFDELLFVGVAAIFLIMMGLSWFVSRNAKPTDPPAADPATTHTPIPPTTPPAQPAPDVTMPADPEQADRFRLE